MTHDIRPYLPEFFTQPGTLLYIGARADAHAWLEELLVAGHGISVLEIWSENAAGLIRWINSNYFDIDVIIGDVKEIDQKLPGNYDYIFYWHGPEHLLLSEIEPVLTKLEQKVNKTLALACPYGRYPQGASGGNPYEEHKSTLYPTFFEYHGFDVTTDGYPDEPGGEIVAWKRKN